MKKLIKGFSTGINQIFCWHSYAFRLNRNQPFYSYFECKKCKKIKDAF